MTLTTAQQVRLRIQDIPQWFDETRYGDGTATLVQLPYRNITTGSAYVPVGGTAWSATGASLDTSGVLTFSGVISANSAFRARGVHSVFSEDEIGHFTAVGGSVLGAAVEAVGALLFDSLKRARWAAPDGTTWDDTAALGQLNDMYDRLREELAQTNVTEGGYAEWTFGQDNWG